MDDHHEPRDGANFPARRRYDPPALADLGSLAELTTKTTGFFDGTEVEGIQLGDPTS